MYVAGHDGDTFGMSSTQICIFHQSNKISFSTFLKSQKCFSCPVVILFSDVVADFSNKTAKWYLSY
ncbi:hypothetical protein X975_27158, partial [Stegodyphus mimosarum]